MKPCAIAVINHAWCLHGLDDYSQRCHVNLCTPPQFPQTLLHDIYRLLTQLYSYIYIFCPSCTFLPVISLYWAVLR